MQLRQRVKNQWRSAFSWKGGNWIMNHPEIYKTNWRVEVYFLSCLYFIKIHFYFFGCMKVEQIYDVQIFGVKFGAKRKLVWCNGMINIMLIGIISLLCIYYIGDTQINNNVFKTRLLFVTITFFTMMLLFIFSLNV